MVVPTSEVGYTSAMPRKEDHEVRKGHVGHWIKKVIAVIEYIGFFPNIEIFYDILHALERGGSGGRLGE